MLTIHFLIERGCKLDLVDSMGYDHLQAMGLRRRVLALTRLLYSDCVRGGTRYDALTYAVQRGVLPAVQLLVARSRAQAIACPGES